MANVVDPNSWRMIPLPDPQHRRRESDRSKIERSQAGRLALHRAATIELLSKVLGQSFTSPGDRIEWNLRDTDELGSDEDRRLRLDAQHELAAPAPQFHSLAEQEKRLERSWLVLVENANRVGLEKIGERLKTAPELDGPVLVVVCDTGGEPSVDVSADLAVSEHIASHVRYDFVGPIFADNVGALNEAMARVRHDGRSTVVFIDARAGVMPAPHFLPPERESRFRDVIAETLAVLGESNQQIVAYSTEVTGTLETVAEPYSDEALPVDSRVAISIKHCASLAARGGKPFLLLSGEQAQNYLGDIRREICLDRRGVTLIVESRSTDGVTEDFGSASLAGIRQLPDIALLAPKDSIELRQMLSWCATQSGPAVVWLPESTDPPVTWPEGSDISLGRAERLGNGTDLAIVAWGTQAAAAAIAAEGLAELGVGTTVVNVRFAQPLDVGTLERVCNEASYVVVLDDAPAGGGFAGWVSEQIIRFAPGVRADVVGPPSAVHESVQSESHAELAATIVQRCRWLSEPIMPMQTTATVPATLACPNLPGLGPVAGAWQRHLLRQPQLGAQDRAQVVTRQLSADVRRWVQEYEKVGSRDLYLWQWCALGVDLTTLPCVRPDLRTHVCDTKVLSIILCVLLDDVADEHGSGPLLDALLEMTCREDTCSNHELSAVESRHAEITRQLWREYWTRVASYPLHDEFAPVLRYDLRQFANTMRYSYLVNGRPYLANLAEHELYTSHNMMMISFATLDLMCSSSFNRAEVGALREAIWHAQCMGRNGNLLSTWRRELTNRDFTSGVFARAVMLGDLTLDELRNGDRSRIEAVICERGHETYFFRQWLAHREQLHAAAQRIESIDLRDVLNGHDRFLAMHLGSEGLI